ncbi:MAG: single-stranded DNA-binding protein [Chloroflexota bacterium]|jgi:single-stranded DNA-binding protein
MATNKNNRPSNYVILTLMAVRDGESRYSQSGKPYAFVRAFLSQGKVKDSDEYKPSVFFDVKGFSPDEEMSDVVQAIADIRKKDRFTVKGRLGMDEWTGDDGAKHQQLVIFAQSITPYVFPTEEGDEEEELEGEPA